MNTKIFDIIFARSLNHGIGISNKLPWQIPEDLKFFKKITTSSPSGNTVIMGRKTFESINKALPNRLNIVVSKNSKIKETEKLRQARSLNQALELSGSIYPNGKNFVIGGSKLIQQALPDCRYIYETFINQEVECDTFIPKIPHPCFFVSKTFRHQKYIFDHRAYYNKSKFSRPPALQQLRGVPEHQQMQYLKAIKDIIDLGQDKIDRTKTGTRSLFGGMMRYDLKETFPVLTHKRVFWRGVAEELLWFVSGSTNAKLLEEKKIHIWDGNSSKQYLESIGIKRQSGDLGPVYGFQWRHWNAQYTDFHADYNGKGIDQLQWIIDEIKKNPTSRRLILTAWNPGQLKDMALPPCHMFCQFQVTNDGRLNCIMYQRSCDMGLGVPFNIASYSLLTCLVAQVTGLKRGQFIHMLGDMHVYNDHIDHLRNIDEISPHPFPTLQIDPSIKNIDDFKFQHLKLKGYKSHPKIEMKMSV